MTALIQFFRKLRSKISYWLYIKRRLVKDLFSPDKDLSPQFRSMVNLRMAEYLGVGKQDKIISGDSIIHGGEAYFESIKGVHCTAIGGDTTRTLMDRLEKNLLIFKPRAVLLHIGGNDFLAGRTASEIYKDLMAIFKKMNKFGVKRIGWLEIIALGNPEKSTIPRVRDNPGWFERLNKTEIPKLTRLVGPTHTIKYRHLMMGDDGWLAEQYRLPDSIHCNALCYANIYRPIAQQWFSAF